jgi:hypothetical protein
MIITPRLYFMILTESSETLSKAGEWRVYRPEVEDGLLPAMVCLQALPTSHAKHCKFLDKIKYLVDNSICLRRWRLVVVR